MDIIFKPSKGIKVNIKEGQLGQISSPERIKKACEKDDVIAFDIFYKDDLIVFAIFKKYDKGKFFLWNYAIDKDYQGTGLGKRSLTVLLSLMKKDYKVTEISTTYIFENEVAKGLYERLGFVETDVIEEEDCHEVNMILTL